MKKITEDIINLLYHIELLAFPNHLQLSKEEFKEMFKSDTIYNFNENGFIVFNKIEESLIEDEEYNLKKIKYFNKYEDPTEYIQHCLYLDDVASIKEHTLTLLLEELKPILHQDIILHARKDNNAWIKLLKSFNHIDYYLGYTEDVKEWYPGEDFKLMVFTKL